MMAYIEVHDFRNHGNRRRTDTVIPFVTEEKLPYYDNDDGIHSRKRATTGKSKSRHGRDKYRFPRIVLRNTAGKELNTDTVFQRAIYEARWRAAKRDYDREPPGPEEWRLPHGPLPARPDYSRQPAKIFSSRRSNRKIPVSESLPVHLSDTVGVEQLRFPPEGKCGFILRNLEELPALAALGLIKYYDGKGLPSRRYIPFTGVAILHDKMTSSTDKREAEYSFPGFCSGCQRAGFCYGCEKERGFHVHQDKVARTGGGFTYYKRDHPLNQIISKNPLNWRGITFPLGNIYDEETYTELQKLGFPLPTAEDTGARSDPALTAAGNVSSLSGIEGVPTVLTFEDPRGQKADLFTLQYGEDYEGYRTGKTLSPSSHFGFTVEHGSADYNGFVDNSEIIRNRLQQSYMDNMTTEERQDLARQQQLPEDMNKEKAVDENEVENQENKKKLYKASVEVQQSILHQKYFRMLSYLTPLHKRYKDAEESKELSPPKIKRQFDFWVNTVKHSAPKPFRLKPHDKKVTIAESPFSENRDFNLSANKQFEVKKSDKETTKFVEIEGRDSRWQEPAKFELKEREKVPVDPWSPPKKKTEVPEKKARSPTPAPPQSSKLPETKSKKAVTQGKDTMPSPPISRRSPSVDSGVESVPAVQSAPTERVAMPPKESTPPLPLPPLPPPPQTRPGDKITPANLELTKKKKEAPVKKERKELPLKKTRKERVTKPATSKLPPKETTQESIREPSPELTSSPPLRPIEPPPLPSVLPPEVPPLPDYAEPERTRREVSRSLIEAPPPMVDPPKQRRPPPTVRPRRRQVEYRPKRRIPPAAPITKQELQQMEDPLDYLAKYCIIHPDRLPHYERVFRKMVGQQQYRYVDVPDLRIQAQDAPGLAVMDDDDVETVHQNEAPLAAREISSFPETQFNNHERKMLRELSLITRTATKDNFTMGMGLGDEVVAKLAFTLDVMLDKYDRLSQKLEDLQEKYIRMVASKARAQFPQVKDANYDPPKKGQKKKKKNKNAVKERGDAQSQTEPEILRGPPTDRQVLGRLDETMLAQIVSDPEISKLELELSRVQEKLKEVDDRIEELEDEKKLMQVYSRDDYHYTQTADAKPAQFMRRQSTLYNKMNQKPDFELNFTDLEEALQQINGHLVTEKEYQYIFHILDLPSRRKINLKLFSVVAALSEKVAQVSPLIKKLINKVDFEALSVKMERSRELFLLLSDQDYDIQSAAEDCDMPVGQVKTSNLAVELAAGGVTQEHVQYIVDKFTRNHCGSVDFLDFLTYVPLFIEIHQRIVKDPLCEKRDL